MLSELNFGSHLSEAQNEIDIIYIRRLSKQICKNTKIPKTSKMFIYNIYLRVTNEIQNPLFLLFLKIYLHLQ